MNGFYILEMIVVAITITITFIGGTIELRLNAANWLNRWFALFFYSASLGFLFYLIYHLIFCSGCESIIISIRIPAQIFFNFIPISLVMTVFILEKSPKVAMSAKYLGIMMTLFILMSFGFFIWKGGVNSELYEESMVDTLTTINDVVINILRLCLAIYAIYKYAIITRKLEGETKRRTQWFFLGIIIVVIGLVTNLAGGVSDIMLIESIALILLNIGAIVILKGFFI